MPLQKHSAADSHQDQSRASTYNKYLLPQSQVIDLVEEGSNQKQSNQKIIIKPVQKPTIKSKSKRKPKQKEFNEAVLQKQPKTDKKKSLKKNKKQTDTKNEDQISLKNQKAKQEDSVFKIIKNQYKEDESNSAKKQNSSERVQDQFLQIDLLNKKKSKGKKQKQKQQIKIKNKYFSDLSVQRPSQIDQAPCESFMQQKLELDIGNKASKNYKTSQKLDKKIDFIKGRMEFKNQDNDLKYKKHLKQKLTQIQDAQQVQISIQMPNLFMNKSVSGALFMKNTYQSQERQQISKLQRKNESAEDDNEKSLSKFAQVKNKNKKMNRTDFFSQLNKQIKTKKQTKISSQQIKQCFKTSTLDQKDNIEEGVDYGNKDLTRRQRSVRNSIGQDSQSIKSFRSSQSSRNSNSSISNKSSREKSFQYKQNSTLKNINKGKNVMIKQEKQSDISNSISNFKIKSIAQLKQKQSLISKQQDNDKQDEALSISKKLSKIAKKIKQKKQIKQRTKQKIKVKKQQQKEQQKEEQKNKRYQINNYFEDEAEASGEDNLQSSEDEEEIDGVNLTGDLVDLIDNSGYLLQKNQHLVKKKYLQDERLQDQILLNRIKNGIFRKVRAQQTESQKRLKKRMYQAAKKHRDQDLDQTQIQDQIIGRQIKLDSSQSENQSKNKSKQFEKLEFQLMGQNRNNKKQTHQQNISNTKQPFQFKKSQDPWKFLNYAMPVVPRQSNNGLQKKQINLQGSRPQQIKRQTKNGNKSRISVQKKGVMQRLGNLNKIQQKKQIKLQFRNKQVSIEQDKLIKQFDI